MKSNGAATILRWGIAFVFFYGAIISLLLPDRTLIHIPEIFTMFIPGRPLLVIFSLYGLALSGLLFWGRKARLSSLLATITFTIIILVDFQYMTTIFPLIGLALASLALFDMSRNTKDNDTLE